MSAVGPHAERCSRRRDPFAGIVTADALHDGFTSPLGNSTGVVLEVVERQLSILADLDEIAVGITHIATPFPTVIV